MDMSGESMPKVLLPKGWRKFKIESGDEQTSKKGNPMFKFVFIDLETESAHEVYAVSTQGKRWFLKQILTACDVEAGQDGVYEWDLLDVIGMVVLGRVEHEPNEWIDRQGKKRIEMQGKIAEVKGDGEIPSPVSEIPEVDLGTAIDEEKAPS